MTAAPERYQYLFTVFTPAYNREGTLHRVYESLCQQTFRDFEWLIVDDGSQDNTRALVEGWQREANFPIRYIHQENQGKHVAFNRGVREAHGELFLTLDSDDACVPTALERFKYYWDAIPAESKDQFSAVTALCIDQQGRAVGNRFPHDITDSDSLEIRYKFKVHGEKWGFHRTDVLRDYPFPEIAKQQYVPEGLVWTKIARRYKTRFVNEPLRIYYIEEAATLTTVYGRTPGKNAVAGQLQHLAALNDHIDFFRYAPVEFCRSAIHYVRFASHGGIKIRDQMRKLTNPLARLLWAIMLPAGLLIYARDKKRQP